MPGILGLGRQAPEQPAGEPGPEEPAPALLRPVPRFEAPPPNPALDAPPPDPAASARPPRPAPTRPILTPSPPPPLPAPRPRLPFGLSLPWSRAGSPAGAAAERLRGEGAADIPPPGPPPGPPAGPSTAPPATLPMPLRAAIEGAAGLAALVLLDRLAGGDLLGWAPSPLLLPVLWAAARGGLAPGLALAALAALLRLLSGAPWFEPLAWLAAGALAGWPALRQDGEARRAEAEAARIRRDAALLEEANARLALRAAEAEARLATRLDAAAAVFEAARAIGQDSAGAIRGAPALLRAATGAAAASLWLLDPGRGLVMVAQEGWPEDAALSRVTGGEGALFPAILAGRTLCVARAADRAALEGEGLLAAPVRAPNGGVMGMVKIEDIGFPDLTPDALAGLEVAAGWVGQALAEAWAHESGMGQTEVLRGSEASRLIGAVTGMARRMGFDLALLSAEIPLGPRAPEQLAALRRAMAETFREADLLVEAREGAQRLSVLLPGTGPAGAEAASARLMARLRDGDAEAAGVVRLGLSVLHAA